MEGILKQWLRRFVDEWLAKQRLSEPPSGRQLPPVVQIVITLIDPRQPNPQ
jgi:hypothetical protein